MPTLSLIYREEDTRTTRMLMSSAGLYAINYMQYSTFPRLARVLVLGQRPRVVLFFLVIIALLADALLVAGRTLCAGNIIT